MDYGMVLRHASGQTCTDTLIATLLAPTVGVEQNFPDSNRLDCSVIPETTTSNKNHVVPSNPADIKMEAK